MGAVSGACCSTQTGHIDHQRAVTAMSSPEESSDDDSSSEEELSFAERLSAQAQGTVSAQHSWAPSSTGRVKAKRKNKNRPEETTSKRPVSRFREVVKIPAQKRRDPRFDNVCGKFNQDSFNASYSFLQEGMQREVDELQREVARNPEDEEAQRRVIQLKSKLSKKQSDDDAQKAKSARRKKEQQLVKKGKKPFFLTQSAVKAEAMAAKFEVLKKAGKLDKYIQKKRKKNASKEKRLLPRQK